MSRLAVAVVVFVLAGCNAVLGLDERGRAPDAAEAVDSGAPEVAIAETSPPSDAPSDAPGDAPGETAPACAFTTCAGGCFDTLADPRHCGRCGEACDDSEYCVAGACRCRAGAANCGTGCMPITASGCAACGASCGAFGAQYCDVAARSCVTACKPGLTLCALGVMSECVNLDTSAFHCGECGNDCENDEVCAAGRCEVYRPALGCKSCPCDCPTGFTCCPGLPEQTTAICVRGARC